MASAFYAGARLQQSSPVFVDCSRTAGSFEVAPLASGTDKVTFWYLKSEGHDFRRCPSCEYIIIRAEGCRYMVCACGHEFNWKSGKDWNSDTMEYVP